MNTVFTDLRVAKSMKLFTLSVSTLLQLMHAVFAEVDLQEAFERHKIVPLVIPRPPTHPLLEIFFFDKVQYGNKMTPNTVCNPPTVLDYPMISGYYYTILIIDPDAPTPKDPIEKDRLHWLLVNVPGVDYNKGREIVEYKGIIKDKEKAPHRYVTLVYEQPNEMEFDERKVKTAEVKARSFFNLAKFVKKYNFSELIAGNYFMS